MQSKLRDWAAGEHAANRTIDSSLRREIELELIERLKVHFPECIVMKVDLDVKALCVYRPEEELKTVKSWTIELKAPGAGVPEAVTALQEHIAAGHIAEIQKAADAAILKEMNDPEVSHPDEQ
jgi:hypothetical protein